jgi:hypothetical protein
MQQIPGDATCVQCGYALRELTGGYCPECGQPFDPNDPDTYARRGRWPWRRGVSPPGTVHLGAVLLMTAIALEDFSVPRSLGLWPCVWLPLALFAALVVAVDYLTRAGDFWRMLRQSPGAAVASRSRREGWWRWLITPLCVGMIGAAVLTDWPVRVRFRLSQPALERVVKAGGGNSNGAQWIGLYHVKVWREPGGVVRFVTHDFFEPVGFVYYPNGTQYRIALAPCWSVWEN